jgi:HK97 family phage prohead protease
MEKQTKANYRGRFSVEGRRLYGFFPYGKRSQKLYENGEGFYEVFEPYSFRESLKTRPVMFLYEHDYSSELDSTLGNARIKEEMVGLKIRIDLPNTKLADRVLNLAADGRLGLSPGFVVEDGDWETRYDVKLRNIRKATLYELSFVDSPAYFDSATCFQIPSTRHIEEPPGRETSVVVSDGLVAFPVEDRVFWGIFQEEGWTKK